MSGLAECSSPSRSQHLDVRSRHRRHLSTARSLTLERPPRDDLLERRRTRGRLVELREVSVCSVVKNAGTVSSVA